MKIVPVSLTHDGGRYHIETSPLIYGAITASAMKELLNLNRHFSYVAMQ